MFFNLIDQDISHDDPIYDIVLAMCRLVLCDQRDGVYDMCEDCKELENDSRAEDNHFVDPLEDDFQTENSNIESS
jgi:hypothetical protein